MTAPKTLKNSSEALLRGDDKGNNGVKQTSIESSLHISALRGEATIEGVR